MTKVRVAGFGVSLDGFSAGIEQSLNNPLGVRGPKIFEWFFHTRTFCSMHEGDGGTVGDVDDQFAQRAMDNFGAFILGRNMFGPVRGPWPDNSWKGWWGDDPPYHAPTFVLTHYEREPLVMEGGTTFYFVTDGIEQALALARKAAGDKDVKIGGGVSTVRQYLKGRTDDGIPISLIFPNKSFGYRTIPVERPLRDAKGKIVLGTKGKMKGKPMPDADPRDTENVPLNEDVEVYFEREVLPHAPDAWIDHEKTKVGYEIPFNRHFYVFKPPRELAEIDADLKVVTDRILTMIAGLSA